MERQRSGAIRLHGRCACRQQQADNVGMAEVGGQTEGRHTPAIVAACRGSVAGEQCCCRGGVPNGDGRMQRWKAGDVRGACHDAACRSEREGGLENGKGAGRRRRQQRRPQQQQPARSWTVSSAACIECSEPEATSAPPGACLGSSSQSGAAPLRSWVPRLSFRLSVGSQTSQSEQRFTTAACGRGPEKAASCRRLARPMGVPPEAPARGRATASSACDAPAALPHHCEISWLLIRQ